MTLCGKSIDTLLIDQPCLVGRTLPGGRVISEGADNEMHCVCFTCIGKMTAAGRMDVAAARKENIVNGSNPIENCLWDDIVVMTTLTNAVSRMKKGNSLKATNTTRLQGFRINDANPHCKYCQGSFAAMGHQEKQASCEAACKAATL